MEFQEMFAQSESVQEAKTLYRKLAFEYHPDKGGDVERMKALNVAYHARLEWFNGTSSVGSDGKEHTYYYRAAHEQAIIDKIADLIRNIPADADVEIRIIGLWIWVEGNTRPISKILKDREGCGMKWHSKRIAWYWKPYAGRSSYNSSVTLDDLAEVYGERKVNRNRSSKQQRSTRNKQLA